MEIKTAVGALAALAQDTRLATYRALVQAGPGGLAAGRIADLLAVPPATLSFHLKELDRAGLITARQDGRYVLYSAKFDQMNALLGFLTENCCRGPDAAAHPDCPDTAALPTACCPPPVEARA